MQPLLKRWRNLQAAEPPPPPFASAEPGPSSASQAAEPPSPGPGSAKPVPGFASQPVEADADREDDLLSELPGEEPDWSNGDHVNEDAFDGTQELHNGLEQCVDTETAGAMLEGIERQQLREAVLLEFLRPVQGSEGAISRELSETQALKEAAPENVRWRSTCVNEADLDMAALVSNMHAMAKSWMQDQEALFPVRDVGLLRGTGVPGSASSAQAEFLGNAHRRSLGVLDLKHHAALREKYKTLVFDFPAITVEKVGEAQLETPEGTAKAIGTAHRQTRRRAR